MPSRRATDEPNVPLNAIHCLRTQRGASAALRRRPPPIGQPRTEIARSAYTELRAGGELHGILRTDFNARREDDGDGREHEDLSADTFEPLMVETAQIAVRINRLYVQALHFRLAPASA